MPLLNARNNCFCAFCKTPRRISRKKNISFMNILGSAMAAMVAMLVVWQQFDPRVIIIFVVCVAISEVFVQLRWRLSIACRQCGFDPILYKKDHAAALRKVQVQLDNRKENPRYLLSKPLNLPTLSAEKSKALKERSVALQEKAKGRLVSRSI